MFVSIKMVQFINKKLIKFNSIYILSHKNDWQVFTSLAICTLVIFAVIFGYQPARLDLNVEMTTLPVQHIFQRSVD